MQQLRRLKPDFAPRLMNGGQRRLELRRFRNVVESGDEDIAPDRKAELLRLIAQVEKVNLAQTIAVGDGANDLPMISEAGLGIAFHAKPRVQANADQSINTLGLDGVLYFLGFKDSYLGEQGKL